MSDVTINTNTKEEVAYKLAVKIAKEGKIYNDRAKLLDLYAECLEATSGLRVSTV